jgi:hypothetical protein
MCHWTVGKQLVTHYNRRCGDEVGGVS